MSVEFKTKTKIRRDAVYMIPPEEIKVKPELNGRTDLPDIEWLIESMVAIGQRQPVEIRKEAERPVLDAGYSRWRAAIEINKRKLVPGGFLLRCVFARCDEKEGFIANIHENIVRNAPTPIDDANNIRRLESWGRSYEEIGKIYHQTPKWVKARLALIGLGEEAREAVKNGRLKPTAAQAIAKLSEELQREAVKGEGRVVAPAPETPKKPTTAMRRAVVHEILRAIVEEEQMPAGCDISGMRAEDAVVIVCAKLREML